MPGYVIHLTEAKIIYEILKQNSNIKNIDLDQWQEDFFYGSLLPDAGGKMQKQKSHFWNTSQNNRIIITPNIEKFIGKYEISLKKNSLYWGYLAHLHLDREFWKCYIKQNVKFLDANGEKTEYIKNLNGIFVKKLNKMISPEEFFSKDYLYGDYTQLNKMLIQKYHLRVPVYNEFYDNKIEEADNTRMVQVLNDLKMYIVNNTLCDTSLKVLSMDTLELFLQKSSQQLVELYDIYSAEG